MYEMVAAIAGTQDVELEAAEALLDWLLPAENSLLLISDEGSPGTMKVHDWCSEVGQDYEICDRNYLIESLASNGDTHLGGNDDADLSFIVIGIEGSEDLIRQAWVRGIEVCDLTRALYVVTEGVDLDMALDEPQIHVHEVSDGLGGRGSLDIFAPQNGSEGRTSSTHFHKPYEACYDDCPEPHFSEQEAAKWDAEYNSVASDGVVTDGEDNTKQWDVKEIAEFMAGIVKAHEERYHQPEPKQVDMPFAINNVAQILAERDAEGNNNREGLIRCLKSPDGKIRVSPRAKAKKTETEVWLTQKEADKC